MSDFGEYTVNAVRCSRLPGPTIVAARRAVSVHALEVAVEFTDAQGAAHALVRRAVIGPGRSEVWAFMFSFGLSHVVAQMRAWGLPSHIAVRQADAVCMLLIGEIQIALATRETQARVLAWMRAEPARGPLAWGGREIDAYLASRDIVCVEDADADVAHWVMEIRAAGAGCVPERCDAFVGGASGACERWAERGEVELVGTCARTNMYAFTGTRAACARALGVFGTGVWRALGVVNFREVAARPTAADLAMPSTCLHDAALHDDGPGIARMLAAVRAEVDAGDARAPRTALECACDLAGHSPLLVAAVHCGPDNIRALARAFGGCWARPSFPCHETALHTVAHGILTTRWFVCSPDVTVPLLVACGVDPRVRNTRTRTACDIMDAVLAQPELDADFERELRALIDLCAEVADALDVADARRRAQQRGC